MKNRGRTLTTIADRIRQIQKQDVRGLIETGKLLATARDNLPHGGWQPWLRREFSWSHRTALRFIQVHDLNAKLANLASLKLTRTALYLLADPATPSRAA